MQVTTDTSNEAIISKLKMQSEECRTLENFIDLAFNFHSGNFSIKPIQKKAEIETLLKILNKYSPKNILEIGTAAGGTFFLLTKIADKKATIISIDLPEGPFGGKYYPNSNMQIYESFANTKQKIHLIRSDSHERSTLKKTKEILNSQKLDFLLIDGDHTYNGVKKDFEMYRELVQKDGIIAFHDINEGPKEFVGGVMKFWKEIKSKHSSFEVIDFHSGEGFGIGFILNSSAKNSTKYLEILKILLNEKSKRIIQLHNKIKTIKNDTLNEPISALLNVYSERPDLQRKFPEASKGNLTELIKWAVWISSQKEKTQDEIINREKLSKFSRWYNDYLENDQNKSLQIQKDVIALEQEREQFKGVISYLKQEKEQFKGVISYLEQEKGQFKGKVSSLEQEKEQFKGKVSSLELEKEQFKGKVSSLEQEKEQFKGKVSSLEQEKEQFKGKVSSLEQEKGQFKGKVSSLEQEKGQFKGKVSSLEQEKGQFKNEISHKGEEIEGLKQELSKNEVQYSALEKDYTDFKNDLARHQQALSDIKSGKGFKIIRFYATKVEKIKLIKNTFLASRIFIKKHGLRSFFHRVTIKIKRGKFTVDVPTLQLSAPYLVTTQRSQTQTSDSPSSSIFSLTPSTKEPLTLKNHLMRKQQRFNYTDSSEMQTYEKEYRVSVVIPTNSDENSCSYLLSKIKSQKGIKDLEIIFVNSGPHNLNSLQKISNVKLINIPPEEFNHGTTRNLGASHAGGEFIIFLSDDAIPSTNNLFYDLCKELRLCGPEFTKMISKSLIPFCDLILESK